ncbi:chorismate synthase [Conexivisphaera calida]|uniref:Chorismate synthase n=1 Tax=Conexivisphaera calida TaxID=1874277 RepID=A0A4P2VLA6_9ARCH|nr:chorismate synthase [Conexivisphaera calida]BBE41955.1 Chorismate synthase [Conexivisphaera calida]
MPANEIGERLRVTFVGESHGRLVGAVMDGVPAGLELSEADLQPMLDLRRPSHGPHSTARAEPDRVEILTGVYRGRTTGAPILIAVPNEDVDSSYYEGPPIPRPGHADYTAWVKYGGYNDPRGGGRFSGRLTAAMVAAGAVSLKLLRLALGVEVIAYTLEIGGVRARDGLSIEELRNRYADPLRCPDPEASRLMSDAVERARRDGDSLGGIVEAIALGVPPGLGEPLVDTLDGDLAKAMFAIPAVKGIEFGAGFGASRLRGSEDNDEYRVLAWRVMKDITNTSCSEDNDEYRVREGRIVTATNNSGGILGGISNGMPIVLRVAFKPVSSIRRPQRSVRLDTMEEVELTVKGRHDVCVVPRAVPVVESMVGMVLADHALRAGRIPAVLR